MVWQCDCVAVWQCDCVGVWQCDGVTAWRVGGEVAWLMGLPNEEVRVKRLREVVMSADLGGMKVQLWLFVRGFMS